MSEEAIGHTSPDPDAWLLVWAGPADWEAQVRTALGSVDPASARAHHVLSREIAGERWSLLLVHYTAAEREKIAGRLRDRWRYGFVNAVLALDKQ